METETIQQTEIVIADEHLPTEGGQPPSQNLFAKIACKHCSSLDIYKIGHHKLSYQYYCKSCKHTFRHRKFIVYPCKQCGELILNSKSLNKKYCDKCSYKRKREYNERWRVNNPEKFKLQYKRGYIRKTLRNGGMLCVDIINCVDCGEDISNRSGKAILCDECAEKHKQENSRKWAKENPERCNELQRINRWNKLEQKGIKFEKRILIDNCIICGQDISMYHSNAKYCSNCSERRSYHTLGTVDFSSHMVRKYNDVVNKVMPDWIAEREAIDSQLKVFGLK